MFLTEIIFKLKEIKTRDYDIHCFQGRIKRLYEVIMTEVMETRNTSKRLDRTCFHKKMPLGSELRKAKRSKERSDLFGGWS